MRMRLFAATLALLGVCAAGTSKADVQYNFDFANSGNAGNAGSSAVYTGTSGIFSASLTAFGFKASDSSSSDLYNKFTSGVPGETGLGMNLDSGGDHEISPARFAQLDLSNLKTLGFHDLSFTIGSLQAHEGFKIYGSNTKGSLGTQIASGYGGDGVSSNDEEGVSFAGNLAYKYYGVIAYNQDGDHPHANILIENGLKISGAPIPEPAFFQLSALLGFGGFGLLRRRKTARK